MTEETLAARVWRQAVHGLDRERLLPTEDKRRRDLEKKLSRPIEKNGWRIFISGQAHAIEHGKAPQKRNAEVSLVTTLQRWHSDVAELLPDRLPELQRLVDLGCANPEQINRPE